MRKLLLTAILLACVGQARAEVMPTNDAAVSAAIKRDCPLIQFHGFKPMDIEGCVSVYVIEYDHAKCGVVISVPDRKADGKFILVKKIAEHDVYLKGIIEAIPKRMLREKEAALPVDERALAQAKADPPKDAEAQPVPKDRPSAAEHKPAGVVEVDGKHITVNVNGSFTGFDGKLYATAEEAAKTVRPPEHMRGAKPSPPHKIFSTPRHHAVKAAPPNVAYIPKKLSFLGNNQYGDCVTAEEGFALQCNNVPISDNDVISCARQNGDLNGADLQDVMQKMARSGMKCQADGHTYTDGGFSSVDFTSDSSLQNAIAVGPVKIAIDANALPSGAGNQMGWYAVGGGRYPNTDHCVSLPGYAATADWFYQQIGMPCPAKLVGKPGYALYTWATIGWVDLAWIKGTTVEAYIRNPCNIKDGTPLPNPGAGNLAPLINSPLTATANINQPFTYTITATNSPTAFVAANLPVGLTLNTTNGVIVGTPTVAAVTSVSIGATNASGTGTSVLVLTVSGVTPPIPPIPPVPPGPFPDGAIVPAKVIAPGIVTLPPGWKAVAQDVTAEDVIREEFRKRGVPSLETDAFIQFFQAITGNSGKKGKP